METLYAFYQPIEMKIQQVKMIPENCKRQIRHFKERHPVLAVLAGIVGVCSFPALVSLTFFTVLAAVVFLSVQSTLVGVTCIALITVIGPLFVAGITLAISCYIAVLALLRIFEMVKYVVSIPAQIWEHTVNNIMDLGHSVQSSLFIAPWHRNESGSSRSIRRPTSRPVIDPKNKETKNRPTTELFLTERMYGQVRDFIPRNISQPYPNGIGVSSNEMRSAFRSLFGGQNLVDALWPNIPNTKRGQNLRLKYKKKITAIENNVCKSMEEESSAWNNQKESKTAYRASSRSSHAKLLGWNQGHEVWKETYKKPCTSGSSNESGSQTSSDERHRENGKRRKNCRTHNKPLQDYRDCEFDQKVRGRPEGYGRYRRLSDSSSDSSEGCCFETKWMHHTPLANQRNRQMADACADTKTVPRIVTLGSDSGSERPMKSISGSRLGYVPLERCKNKEPLQRSQRSDSNSDSGCSSHIRHSRRRKNEVCAKIDSDYRRRSETSASQSSGNEFPPFDKQPVPTGLRPHTRKGKSSHKSRDRIPSGHHQTMGMSCDHHQTNGSYMHHHHCYSYGRLERDFREHVVPTSRVSSPKTVREKENYVTTSDEREFYDAKEEDDEYNDY